MKSSFLTLLAGLSLFLGTCGVLADTNAAPGVSLSAVAVAPSPVRSAATADENVLAAGSNAVNLAQSAQRLRAVPGGGVAEFGLHKVYFPADLAGHERFGVTTPNGRRLAFRPRFLAWHDTDTDQRWVLAQVTNRLGLIVPSGQVWYTNAFDSGIQASLRYRYSRYALEQDVILTTRPPLPEGAVAEHLQLEIWTEWFDSTPSARRPQVIDLRQGSGVAGRSQVADEQLDFVTMRIGNGHAFSTAESGRPVPVAKRWLQAGGRNWLIETVDYPALRAQLEALAPSGGKRTAQSSSSCEALIRSLAHTEAMPTGSSLEIPPRAGAEAAAPPLFLAQADIPEAPGVVVDFAIISCVPVPAGIISWWPGDNSAADAITGSANNGTLHNAASYGPGQVGQGFSFSGGDYVQIPNAASLNPTDGLTVEAWIYFPANASGQNMPIASKDGGNGRQYLLTKTWDDVVRAHVGIAGQLYWTEGQIVLESDTWNHVAMTYSATAATLTIYVNGELDVAAPVSGNLLTSSEPLYLGGAPYWSYYWEGDIDEASIYDRALSPLEIQMIYEAGAAGKINPNCATAPADLSVWFPGDNHPYSVSSGHTATLQNGAGYAPAVASQGFKFDGVNDGVTVAHDATGALDIGAGQDFSIEVWFQAETHSTSYGVMSVLGKRYSPNSSTALGWELFLVNGQPGLQLADAYGPANFIASGDLRDGGWHHVVVTVDRDSSTGGHIYVDGAQLLQFSPTGKSGNLSNTDPLRLGVHPQTGLNCFYKGIIDEATVYRRALSGTEVSTLFQAGSAGKSKIDLDNDGLPDWWEMHFFGGLSAVAESDSDQDGLSNLAEYAAGTDPTTATPVENPENPTLGFDYWRKESRSGTTCTDTIPPAEAGGFYDNYKSWIWASPGVSQRGYGKADLGNDCLSELREYWWNQAWITPSALLTRGHECMNGPFSEAFPIEYLDSKYGSFSDFEKCSVAHTFPNDCEATWDFSRSADTKVYLYPSRAPQTVIFTPTATEIEWDDEWEWWFPGDALDPGRISIDGKTADCNGEIPVRLTTLNPKDVTPSILGAPEWYNFNLPFRQARLAVIARAYHPALNPVPTLQALQNIFDLISQELAIDHDVCTPNGDASVQPGGAQYLYDDVRVYVDFELTDSIGGTVFPSEWNGFDFTSHVFNIIDEIDDLNDLVLQGSFANLKQVSSLPPNYHGAATWGSMVVPMPTTDPRVYAHEWGHTEGLDDNSFQGFLMCTSSSQYGWKVNRPQKAALE